MLCWTPGIDHRIPLEDMGLGKDSRLKQLSKGSCQDLWDELSTQEIPVSSQGLD